MDDQEAYDFYANPENLRPAGPPRKRRGVVYSMRFTPEQLAAVESRALAEGVTIDWWLRRLVQKELDRGRTFSCPHLSIGNVVSAECATCGPLEAVA